MTTTNTCKKTALTASPDGRGILSLMMALRTLARDGIEVTGTSLDSLVRTPSARQIQADGRKLLPYRLLTCPKSLNQP